MEAVAEPLGLCLRIIEMRSYAEAKRIVKTTKLDDLPDTPMIRMVDEIKWDRAKEAKEARRRKSGR